jgi:hypothetical protein
LLRHNAANPGDALSGEHFEASGDTWDADYIEFATEYADMTGTHCGGEFKYSVTVRPVPVSTKEIACVKSVKDLDREALEEIVMYARDGLFLDIVGDREVYSLDKPVSGADYIEHMTSILAEHDLVPRGPNE